MSIFQTQPLSSKCYAVKARSQGIANARAEQNINDKKNGRIGNNIPKSYSAKLCPSIEDSARKEEMRKNFASLNLVNRSLSDGFCTLSAFDSSSIPIGVRTDDQLKDDQGFQDEVQKLVDDKTIDNHTFVICDTGHDIPVFAKLLDNNQLSIKGSLNLPKLFKGSEKRILAQSNKWSDDIRESLDNCFNDHKRGALFVGLETHRLPLQALGKFNNFSSSMVTVDSSKLPTDRNLKAYGINKIVYLKEAVPGVKGDIDEFVKADIYEYLKNMESKGLEIICTGIDPRRKK